MSSLLLDEYPLLVLPSLAVKVGLNEAIILQQVHYWLQNIRQTKGKKNSDYERHFKDGNLWIYNTYQDWLEQFPFWSLKTIQRTIEKLEKCGLLISGNYNEKRYDQTKWYTLDMDKINSLEKPIKEKKEPANPRNSSFSQNDQMDLVKMTKPVSQNDQMDLVKMTKPIPETLTEISTEISAETTTTEQEKNVVVVPPQIPDIKRIKTGLVEIGITTITEKAISGLLAFNTVKRLERCILNVAADVKGKATSNNHVRNAASLFLSYAKNPSWESQFLAKIENQEKRQLEADDLINQSLKEIEEQEQDYEIQNPLFKEKLAKIEASIGDKKNDSSKRFEDAEWTKGWYEN